MKKILSPMHGQVQAVLRKCLILFTMLLTVSLSARAQQFEVDDLSYKVLSEADRTVEVSDYNGRSTDVVIPETVENNGVKYAVIGIGEWAFSGCISLTSVTIPNSVTSIGIAAFNGCTSLASVTIPNSVTSIGSSAFCDCTSLTAVTIPNSVTSIVNSAFDGCTSLEEILVDAENPNYSSENGILYNKDMTELIQCPCAKKEVIIPNSVISIGEQAFADCTSLISVTIPNSVTSIGEYAFSGCTSLASVTIPDSVTSMEGGVFYNCSALTSVTIPSSLTCIENNTFRSCTSLVSVAIPSSVTSIGSMAFHGCTSLTSVTIPNSVTIVGDSAFTGCESLTSVTIPNSTRIGEYAFSSCTSLTSVTMSNSVTSIGRSAFAWCTSLASVSIPNSVTSIEGAIFSDCVSLKEILVDADNANYCSDNGVLYNKDKTELIQCPGAKKEVTIPTTVTNIGAFAFSGCSFLASVTIPNSVTSIGDFAFARCTSLKTIYSEPTTPPQTLNAFSEVPTDAVVYVPEGTIGAYSQAWGWNHFTDFREMTSTGVSELTVGQNARRADIYNMHGILVKANASQADVDALAPGLYIIGGRKVLVK